RGEKKKKRGGGEGNQPQNIGWEGGVFPINPPPQMKTIGGRRRGTDPSNVEPTTRCFTPFPTTAMN
ncbi:hypothetical protein EY01_14795, partial [Staphylococcus aureus]